MSLQYLRDRQMFFINFNKKNRPSSFARALTPEITAPRGSLSSSSWVCLSLSASYLNQLWAPHPSTELSEFTLYSSMSSASRVRWRNLVEASLASVVLMELQSSLQSKDHSLQTASAASYALPARSGWWCICKSLFVLPCWLSKCCYNHGK